MPVVRIEGVGNVEFPESMSQPEIMAALKRLPEAAPPIPEVIQQSKPPSPELEYLKGAIGEAADMATLGFSDELAALTNPLQYSKTLDRMQTERDRFREDNPWSALGYSLAGIGGAPAALYKGITGLSSAPVMPYIAGLTEGAIAGAGQGDESRTRSAAFGAVVGGLSPAATNLFGLGMDAVRKGGGYLFGTKPRSARVIDDMLEDSMLSDAQIMREAERLGPEAALVDILGESGIAHGQKLVTRNPAARAYTRKVIEDRAAGAPDRITRAMYGSLDEQPGSFQVVQALNKRRSEAARPLYKQAFAEDQVDLTKLDLTDGQVGVLNSMRGEVEKIMQAFGETPQTATRSEYLHWLKYALDGKISAEKDIYGKLSPLGAGYSKIRSQLDDALKTNPTYARAAQVWSGEQKLIEAAEAGRKALNPDLRKTISQIREMSADEKTVYGASLLETVHNRTRNRAPGSASNFNAMEGMRFKDVADEVLDTNRIQAIDDMLDAERRFATSESKLLGGSQTSMRAEDEIRYQGLVDMVAQWVKGIQGKLSDDEAMRVTELLVTPGGAIDALEFARSRRGFEPLTTILEDLVRYSAPVYGAQLGAE